MQALRVIRPTLTQSNQVDAPRYVTLVQGHNQRGSLEFETTTADPAFKALAQEGARIVVVGPSGVPWSGPITYEDGPATTVDTAIRYNAADDWGRIMDFPVPVNPDRPASATSLTDLAQSVRSAALTSPEGRVDNQIGYYAWRDTGSAEGTVKAAIADAIRWWGEPNIRIAPNRGRGGSPAMLPPTRFATLEEVCVPILEAAGLGLRIAQGVDAAGRVEPWITVDVWQPRTYAQTIRPGSEIIQSGRYGRDRRPKANDVVIGGPGQDASRHFARFSDSPSIAAHGHVPRFQDSTGAPVKWPEGLEDGLDVVKYLLNRPDVTAEAKAAFSLAIADAGRRSLDDGKMTAALNVALAVTDGFFLGTRLADDGQTERGFDLGDAIPVEAAGVPFTERIRRITATVTRNGGDQVTPSFGAGTSDEIDVLAREITKLGRKIAALTTSR